MEAREEQPHEYPEWEETLDRLSDTEGTILLLGGVDTGKTTFACLLINRMIAKGRTVGLLDGDVGQSEIGPPSCLGLGRVEHPLLSLSGAETLALTFLGSLSPVGHLMEYAVAVRSLADRNEEKVLIVDTGGYIGGSGAMRLQKALCDLLRPKHLVALAHGEELAGLLAPLRVREDCHLHLLSIPAVIGKKPARYRAQRREMKFAAYFQDSKLHTFSFDEVILANTWLGKGVPVAAHLLKFISGAMGPSVRVYHAEMEGRHLGLMVHTLPAPQHPGLSLVQEQMKANRLSLTVAPRLKHLLLGLEKGDGRLLGLGLLEKLDFRRRTLGVLTPVRAPAAAPILRFGYLRVTPEGKETGTLKIDEF